MRLPLLFLAFASPGLGAISLTLEHVVNAPQPVAMAHAGDERLFIADQVGRILIYNRTELLAVPFLDIESKVLSGGERGLLGVAFHPDYINNGFFYVNYTDRPGGHTVVERYRVSSNDPDRADPNSGFKLITINQPFPNHNGGQIMFGPDGYLYIGMGDGGSGGDPQNNGQRLNSLLGKILRIDVDNGTPYGIPPDNPFRAMLSGNPEIWSYGLRNPWRFTFDRSTGDMFIADVGQNAWEEISFQPASSVGGENYGWRFMEGNHCYNPSTNCNTTNLVRPILEYSHAGGNCSVTGGYRYRGARYPALRGVYIYGDLCSGRIWGATQGSSGAWETQILLVTSIAISTFGEDVNGELYVADHVGAIYHLHETSPQPPRRRAVRR